MFSLTKSVSVIFLKRGILFRTTLVEVRRRYAGSILGMAWLLLGPAFLMILYSLIYGIVFKLRPTEMSSQEYIIFILTGLIPFLGFSDALTSGAASLATQRELLLNTTFPAELVPLRAVLVAFSGPVVGLVILMGADGVLGRFSGWNLFAPAFVMLLAMFVTGLVWLLSLANLVIRDIQQIISYFVMGMLVVSPIAYLPSMLPQGLSLLIWLNPLSYYIMALQSIVIFDRFPSAFVAVTCLVLSLASFAFGWRTFQRAKTIFFDYA